MARAELVGKVAVVVAVVFYCLVVVAPYVVEGALTCEQVVSDLAPCGTYLINGGTVSTDCCNGVKSLNGAATTTDDRQTVCKCTEQTATTLPGVKIENVRSLPGKCGLNIDFDISLDTDCSKYIFSKIAIYDLTATLNTCKTTL
ncbi:putative plant non-specific lipid-transfer protein/Par allergen [Helianthus annuus]|nr:putative plant non-specific lipid-transfer protein/Par allergen [Helianthus annuus]KAJ0738471.1 putative plant non-specific lipid-transfer protein/Par allergen [Helianthus annuus]KAJ0741357.1 putative plant non-specific lipid-transfer protein/Par allergen [Helianthus annuus]